MLARQIAIGFGIAIVFPLLIYYGVTTFSPAPKLADFYTAPPFNANATPQERQEHNEKSQAGMKAYNEAAKAFAARLLYVSAPLGYAAILFGAFTSIAAVGTGLIFGGLFSVAIGYWEYWAHLENWLRFVSLLVALAVLLFIGYRKLPRRAA
jgi:hypothetical protein